MKLNSTHAQQTVKRKGKVKEHILKWHARAHSSGATSIFQGLSSSFFNIINLRTLKM